MSHRFFENLKRSLKEEPSHELIQNLVDELKIFFQVVKLKLSSTDPQLAKDAAQEIAELRAILEKHPLLTSSSP